MKIIKNLGNCMGWLTLLAGSLLFGTPISYEISDNEIPQTPETTGLSLLRQVIVNERGQVRMINVFGTNNGSKKTHYWNGSNWRLVFDSATLFSDPFVRHKLIGGNGREAAYYVAGSGTTGGVYRVDLKGQEPPVRLTSVDSQTNFEVMILKSGQHVLATSDINPRQIRVRILGSGEEQVIQLPPAQNTFRPTFKMVELENGGLGVAIQDLDLNAEGTIATTKLTYGVLPRPLGSASNSFNLVYLQSFPKGQFGLTTPSLDLALDTDGFPFVASSNEGDANVLGHRFTPQGWETHVLDANNPTQFSLLAFPDDQGNPTVKYLREGGASPAYFSSFNGLTWQNPIALNFAGSEWTVKNGYLYGVSRSSDGFAVMRAREMTDNDGDGLSYLYEQAFVSNPSSSSSRGGPSFSLQQGKPNLTATVLADTQKLANSNAFFFSSIAQIEYVVEVSDDLKTWDPAEQEVTSDLFTIQGRRILVVTQNGKVSDGSAKAYMRMGVRKLR